ncbi:hypothetical protein PIROE2DRAFT_14567 [Piromyces sp. E2]|nr:hypothetical protein PIROE2DRAFT_14567 [Piromyces sp. E2]|eukprot:OUM59801.1 hypothetical protein PIROE2DRAFT_14567 [Piromyces sp. E2]
MCHVIVLQGLPGNVLDQSVQATLEALGASYENLKVIRDKQTGLARGFAFVKFISIEHARQFIDTYFPFIDIEGTKVKIDYSTSTSHEDEDWNCPQCGFLNFKRREQCYKCGVPKNAGTTQVEAALPLPGEINDGEKDIGDTPIPLLLLRYLDPISTEDTIYNSMSMIAPVKEVRLVKDRLSSVSWGFAFVEYYDLDAANSAYYYIYQNGYQIDNRQISVSYAHVNSFVPVYVQNEWSTVSYTDEKGNVKFMKYWDEQAYVSIYPPPEHVPLPNTAESYANRLAVNTEETKTTSEINDKPDNSVTIVHKTTPKQEPKVLTKSNKFEIKIDLKKSASSAKPKESMDDLLNAFYSDIKEDIKDTPNDNKKNIFSVDPVIPSNPLESSEKEMGRKRSEVNNPSSNAEKEQVAIPTVEEINSKYINYQSNACLLCMRGFNSSESLVKHQNVSKLHKKNIDEYIRKFKEEHNISTNEVSFYTFI